MLRCSLGLLLQKMSDAIIWQGNWHRFFVGKVRISEQRHPENQ